MTAAELLRRRPDSFEIFNGVEVQFRADAEPSIQWDHIDGPLLHSRFAQIEWLTFWERFLCWIGRADARSLERKHWPELADRWDARALAARLATPDPGYVQGFDACREAVLRIVRSDKQKAYWSSEERLDKLVAAIAVLPATAGVEDWRPIETAPKDGRQLLLAFTDNDDEWGLVQGWYESGIYDRRWYDIYSEPIEPKYWRPLPAPPTILAKPAQEVGS